MKLYKLPPEVKNDLERKSLELLRQISRHIVVVGGWAARAHGGRSHIRYTFDIDGVCSREGLKRARQLLEKMHFSLIDEEWGCRAAIPYNPPRKFRDKTRELKIKVEMSGPRIYEVDGTHYFEFNLEKTENKEAVSIDGSTRVSIRVPKIDYLVANKLGLPPLFKNMYDGCLLTLKSNVSAVANLMESINRWDELARQRMIRTLGFLRDRGTMLHRELSKTEQISEMRQRIERILDGLHRRSGSRLSPASARDC